MGRRYWRALSQNSLFDSYIIKRLEQNVLKWHEKMLKWHERMLNWHEKMQMEGEKRKDLSSRATREKLTTNSIWNAAIWPVKCKQRQPQQRRGGYYHLSASKKLWTEVSSVLNSEESNVLKYEREPFHPVCIPCTPRWSSPENHYIIIVWIGVSLAYLSCTVDMECTLAFHMSHTCLIYCNACLFQTTP